MNEVWSIFAISAIEICYLSVIISMKKVLI